MSGQATADVVITSLMGHTSIATSHGHITARQAEQRAALEAVTRFLGIIAD